jgi:NAD(P)-dependent dehydrogenase (short-subunit alcohol dehydrogenase family)
VLGQLSEVSAVVLGAGGGIGSACARRLAAAGAHVVGVDRRPLVSSPCHDAVIGDAGDASVLRDAFHRCPTRPGVVVHAVLGEVREPLHRLRCEDWHAVFEATVVSAWRAGCELLQAARGQPASVVLVGSVHAHGAVPGMATYAVAKAALPALARAGALAWGPLGVRCNVVEPGFVAVPRNQRRWQDPQQRRQLLAAHPLGRLCTPDEVAEVVVFLSGPGASYVNGVSLAVDGGSLARLPAESAS